eukprot:scaffold96525_cov31-Tisochrysis_lutea.AAC.1
MLSSYQGAEFEFARRVSRRGAVSPALPLARFTSLRAPSAFRYCRAFKFRQSKESSPCATLIFPQVQTTEAAMRAPRT